MKTVNESLMIKWKKYGWAFRLKDRHFIQTLIAASMLLFFFGLGNMALTDPDETFYAQTAKEMLNAGEWVTPIIFGRPQFEKPILYYLLVIFSYMIFGIGEFAARFPSAVFGTLGVLGVYFLGRLMFSRACGLISGLILATCVGYIGLARACVTDIVLTVFVLYCLFFFLMGWVKNRKLYYFMSAAMAGLAVLTKGPIGAFIPGTVIVLYIALSHQWMDIRKIPFGWSILAFLAVSAPWYVAVIRVHGELFINEFFGFQNITRFIRPEHRISGVVSLFFYIPVIIGGFFPWSFFLPVGAWDACKYKSNDGAVRSSEKFLFSWFLVIFTFFTIARTKLVTYILPVFPALAILVGRFCSSFLFSRIKNERLENHMRNALVGIIGSSYLSMAIINYFIIKEYPSALSGVLRVEIILFCGLLASLILFLKGKKKPFFLVLICTIIFALVPAAKHVMPEIGKFESTKVISLKAKELADINEPIGGESDYRRGIAFYTDRTDIIDIHSSIAEPDKFVSRKERIWGIVRDKHYMEFKENQAGIKIRPVFRFGKHVLFTNLPDNGGQ